MTDPSAESRALRQMIDEARAESLTPVAWDELEARLLYAVDRDRARSTAYPAEAPWSRLFAYVAVAAAMVLGIGAAGRLRATADEPRSGALVAIESLPVLSSRALDARALHVGDRIETNAEPIRFEVADAVRWTAGPRSIVEVRAVGDSSGVGQTVQLVRGELRAEVVPRPASEGLVEAFGVEVGRTRVAVHGTAFRVVNEGESALVEVDHGAVAVGPVGHVGETTGHLLVGRSRARFSLDGGREAVRLEMDSTDAPSSATAPVPNESGAKQALDDPGSPAPSSRASSGVAPTAFRGVVNTPPSAEPEARSATRVPTSEPTVAPSAAPLSRPTLTASVVRSGLIACFGARQAGSFSSVRISFASQLRFTLRPDGTIQAARFEPPIAPELQSCAVDYLGGRFPEASGSA